MNQSLPGYPDIPAFGMEPRNDSPTDFEVDKETGLPDFLAETLARVLPEEFVNRLYRNETFKGFVEIGMESALENEQISRDTWSMVLATGIMTLMESENELKQVLPSNMLAIQLKLNNQIISPAISHAHKGQADYLNALSQSISPTIGKICDMNDISTQERGILVMYDALEKTKRLLNPELPENGMQTFARTKLGI